MALLLGAFVVYLAVNNKLLTYWGLATQSRATNSVSLQTTSPLSGKFPLPNMTSSGASVAPETTSSLSGAFPLPSV